MDQQPQQKMEDRSYFYGLVDNIPEDKLEELERTLLVMAMPVAKVTEEELEEIRLGQQEIANGDYVHFETFEEMDQYFLNDDNIQDDEEED